MPMTLTWVKDLQFVAEDDKGHGIVIESKQEGAAAGFTPMQLLLQAAACCMAMDVVSILQKKRLPLKKFRVLMDGDRAAGHPKRFTEMRFTYEATGDIPQEAIDEAIKMSEEKYCSVSATLKTAPKMVIGSRVVTE